MSGLMKRQWQRWRPKGGLRDERQMQLKQLGPREFFFGRLRLKQSSSSSSSVLV
jgi:hypothetical protein